MDDVWLTLLQAVAAVALTGVSGVVTWCVLQIVRINGTLRALEARVKAESKATDRRLGEQTDWLKALASKSDEILSKIGRQ